MVTLLVALLAIGPVYHPIEGEEVTSDDRDLLPAARHVGAVADMWFLHIINMQAAGGGGIEMFDPLRLSAHGRSWSQLTYSIGEVDATDPARPGQGIIDVPHLAWDTLRFRSLWTDAPGMTWNWYADPGLPKAASVTGTFGGEVGGGLWLPYGVFDREPASNYGAPQERRALRQAGEATLRLQAPVPWGAVRLAAEHLSHRHRYLTLAPNDDARRETVMLASKVGQVDLLLAWQERARGHEGAQYRWPEAITQKANGQAWLGQAETRLTPMPESLLTVGAGFGWRRDVTSGGTTGAGDTTNFLVQPKNPEELRRWHLRANARFEVADLAFSLRGSWAQVRDFTLQDIRGAADWLTPEWLGATWLLHLGADYGALGTRIGQFGPSVGVAARWALGEAEAFTLVRREPERLTAQLAAASYTLGDVSRPASNQFAVGYKTAPFGAFRWTVAGVARGLTDRYTLDYAASNETPTSFRDPGGDGRGEPMGGQDLTAYDGGGSGYVLNSDGRIAYFLGFETNLVSEPGRSWFVNAGGAAYLSAGAAPFGNGSDLNDPGVVSAASVGRNNQTSDFGRYDHDRAFSLKAMAGWLPLDGLSLALAARYRDGEPFSRVVTAPNGAQLMAVSRGEARYTFHMTWDVRVRYAKNLGPIAATAWLDVFNLFGSGVELLEDAHTGPGFRRALEAIPHRAAMLSLELSVPDVDA